MINYKNPAIELVPNPTGLDNAIQVVQAKLAGLSWLQKAFGKAIMQQHKNITKDKRQNQGRAGEIFFPEVYNQREPLTLMMNDNLQSYCFFHPLGEMTFDEWEPFTLGQTATQPIAIIFWGNLEKIDSTKNYQFAEELRKEVIQVLKTCTSLKVESSTMEFDAVFDPFTITDNFKTFLKPPFFAFRFDGTITFDYLNC